MRRSSQLSASSIKWLCLIVFLLIGYGLLQPSINRRMGWTLPTLAQLLGEEASRVDRDSAEPVNPTHQDSQTSRPQAPAQPEIGQPEKDQPEHRRSEAPAVSAQPTTTPDDNRTGTNETQKDNLLYGLLRQTRRDEYVSPAGLRYTRGSEEGHRLEHLKKHLEDQPSRPGRHGVFHGDMPQVLRVLDDAYSRAKAGARGTKKLEEDGRTIYEVTFSKPVGYVGGRDGKRQNHPDAKRLRMVLDEDRLITAFPF